MARGMVPPSALRMFTWPVMPKSWAARRTASAKRLKMRQTAAFR